MQLIASRTYPYLDDAIEQREARDSLFKTKDAYLLYMRSVGEGDERVIWLDFRAALLWLNASADEFGREWPDDQP